MKDNFSFIGEQQQQPQQQKKEDEKNRWQCASNGVGAGAAQNEWEIVV